MEAQATSGLVFRKQCLRQDLLAQSLASLIEVYDLVPEVSLGKVSAGEADRATERLHGLFDQLLGECDNVSWLERQASQVLDPDRLHIWRKHLDIVLWSRAWSALRAQQRKAHTATAAASTELSDADAENILPAAAPLANAFMRSFEEELRAQPRKEVVAEAEKLVAQEVQALLQQNYSWEHLFKHTGPSRLSSNG